MSECYGIDGWCSRIMRDCTYHAHLERRSMMPCDMGDGDDGGRRRLERKVKAAVTKRSESRNLSNSARLSRLTVTYRQKEARVLCVTHETNTFALAPPSLTSSSTPHIIFPLFHSVLHNMHQPDS